MGKMQCYLFSDITGIEQDELICGTDRISLSVCAANWAQAHPSSYPDPAHCRCVGERWASEQFILYAEDHILLVNDIPESHIQKLLNLLHIPLQCSTRRYDRIRQVQQMLLDAGWTTCDMT